MQLMWARGFSPVARYHACMIAVARWVWRAREVGPELPPPRSLPNHQHNGAKPWVDCAARQRNGCPTLMSCSAPRRWTRALARHFAAQVPCNESGVLRPPGVQPSWAGPPMPWHAACALRCAESLYKQQQRVSKASFTSSACVDRASWPCDTQSSAAASSAWSCLNLVATAGGAGWCCRTSDSQRWERHCGVGCAQLRRCTASK
jgi:hypothetical protein